ncbi:hypothetical protein VE01_04640 [Pseudogymnoascus verrucosus]|uniref:CST complex subunit Stn1 N-terminal domain-containing protein n=1 Tax=Pseudogymnoascus verrucosus TaxID=342668 RepID=A0A1B8GN00_9PEZI|nr:uncharacterized protein VE01_04640 [Pseudogymnoascus verrucosus]OBT97207.1 hypothetical protein VE01_04640 [Pseudogymnoascus verrucosus]
MANSGPPPARLCALSDLWERGVGEKVRVLGCITNYNTTTAILTLHPPHSPSPHSSTSTATTPHNHTAQIDLSLLLSSTPPPVTAIGEWVNVIGYITSQQSAPSAPPTSAAPPTGRGERGSRRRGGKEGGSDGEETKGEHHTSIQALLLWSAGGLNVQEYEEVVRDLKAEREKTETQI